MLSTPGKCKFITLLWGPDQEPDRIEQEFREAVWAGSAMAGFWIYPPGHPGGGGVKMEEGSYEAIARAFASAENEWLKFYRANILGGDARFVIVDGEVGKEETTLRVKNTGKKVEARVQGNLDLKAMMPLPPE